MPYLTFGPPYKYVVYDGFHEILSLIFSFIAAHLLAEKPFLVFLVHPIRTANHIAVVHLWVIDAHYSDCIHTAIIMRPLIGPTCMRRGKIHPVYILYIARDPLTVCLGAHCIITHSDCSLGHHSPSGVQVEYAG